MVRDHVQWIHDKDTLNEMLTFVRNEKGRPEAQMGAHDDCVMALAIGYFTRARTGPREGGEELSPFVSVGKSRLKAFEAKGGSW